MLYDNRLPDETSGKVIAKDMQLMKRIGTGGFGEVWKAHKQGTDEYFAIKFVLGGGGLRNEARTNQYLWKDSNPVGIPKVIWLGQELNREFIIMDLLGKNIGEIFEDMGKKFSKKTVYMLADQMIQRIEFIHSKKWIHRDIKPENFAFGLKPDTKNTLYIYDFGLMTRYKNGNDHIEYKEAQGVTVGTSRYISLNCHKRNTLGRRDDLESLAYTLIFLAKGTLPWLDIKVKSKVEREKIIGQRKEQLSMEEICEGIPECFYALLEYSRNLDFYQDPDYEYCRYLFREQMADKGWNYDNIYDWC